MFFTKKQSAIDGANARFWNELCGSGLARHIGLKDQSPASLRRFDQAFLDLYPYVMPMLKPERLAGRRVLEIGLGYGTIGQKLAEHAGEYTGLDIAANPVQMMNDRMSIQGLRGKAVQGSALEMPFPDGSFDFVLSIGCFHHTGNVQRCLDETYRVLAPGGSAFVMLYNQFGLRQWMRWPKETLHSFVDELFGPPAGGTPETVEVTQTVREFVGKMYRVLTQTETPTAEVGPALRAIVGVLLGGPKSGELTAEQRAAYDANKTGEAAPETVLSSINQLRRMLHRFEAVTFSKHNADPLIIQGKLVADRPDLLPTLARVLGLDIYFEARKGTAQEVRDAA